MYLDYFGLERFPFSLTPNTHFFAQLPRHKDCVEMASTVLNDGEGFVKITGEVGTGKTLLCRELLNRLDPKKYYTAFIPNPYLSPQELRYSLAHDLGLDVSRSDSDKGLLEIIYKRMTELSQQNTGVVLVVDEVQAMSDETLEALRLLTNLETEEKKLMQIVLFGQPEFDVRLNQYNLRQLKQRITFSGKILPLSLLEVQQYIQFRLTKAGYNGNLLFPDNVIKLIHANTQGIPRLINIISHKALMLAYGQNKRQITKELIKKAVIDTDISTNNNPIKRNWFGRKAVS